LPDGTLGAPCTSNTDCVDPLSCITNVQTQQGIVHLPGGTCSSYCTGPLDCPDAICVQVSSGFMGYCAESCNYGPSNATAFNA
jgi:hypothetical protein